MSRSSTSLVKLFEFDGSSTTMTPTKVKVEANIANCNIKADVIKYYQTHGMENIAKEVGIIHSNGEKSTARVLSQTPQRKAIIALPVVSNACNMSPFKMEQAILPKTIHLANSPVILSSPQRMVANVINSPRTPHMSTSDHMSWSGKRPRDMTDSDYSDGKKCKKGEKGGKGLRHFSMKVCEKVRRKGTTSYNEVADELVAEFSEPHRNMCPTEQAYDQKNIRRRVYDALNVLMAMNIISKEKKEIKWLGLPTNSAQEYQNLEREKQRRIERIRVKTQHLQELIHQQVAFKNLVERNKTLEQQNILPTYSSRIHLPFIIVNTDKKTVIDCSISPDKTEYLFHFNDTFQIHDDIEILKRMGMVLNLDKGSCTAEELDRAKNLLPRALEPYVIQMAQGQMEYAPASGESNNGIQLEGEVFSDPVSDFQEPSSSMLSTDYMGVEVALEASQSGMSRPSSIGSDMPSRQDASASEEYTDSEPESSGAEDN